MEGFESIESAERYARLLVGCYRFKRFTDSQDGSNGKAPLELAGVDLGVGIGFRSCWIARSADAGACVLPCARYSLERALAFATQGFNRTKRALSHDRSRGSTPDKADVPPAQIRRPRDLPARPVETPISNTQLDAAAISPATCADICLWEILDFRDSAISRSLDKALELARYIEGAAPHLYGCDSLPRRLRRGRMRIVGTGVVEKHQDLLVGRRMKRRGMRWTRGGADNLLALQARRFSDQWPERWGVVAA